MRLNFNTSRGGGKLHVFRLISHDLSTKDASTYDYEFITYFSIFEDLHTGKFCAIRAFVLSQSHYT